MKECPDRYWKMEPIVIRIMSVSYTHLDVYKRQDKFREGMTRCEPYPLCFGTIYFPTDNHEKISPQ